MENKSYEATWTPSSAAAYLAKTLRAQGKLLTNYYATGHASLDNYISMISGQPPNVDTQADCQTFANFVGAVGPDGIAVGQGCVYPAGVRTIVDQLDAKGLTWKGYMEDMGNNPVRDNGVTCAHPPIGVLSNDPTQAASPGDQYATRHNPFVYFHSIIDRPACATGVVPLKRLPADLANAATTPNLVFITPNLCNDGHDGPCVDGKPGGLTGIGTFAAKWAPLILASPAFRDGGMLIVTFDESDSSDAAACCNEPTGPNTPRPGIGGRGGGRVGALVISPFVLPGTVSTEAYNHYSMLRSIEDIFGLDHLGFAAADGLTPFGTDVYDHPLGSATPAVPQPTIVGFARADDKPTLAASGANETGLALAAAAFLVLAVVLRRRLVVRSG
jgi:hypothetical protein